MSELTDDYHVALTVGFVVDIRELGPAQAKAYAQRMTRHVFENYYSRAYGVRIRTCRARLAGSLTRRKQRRADAKAGRG